MAIFDCGRNSHAPRKIISIDFLGSFVAPNKKNVKNQPHNAKLAMVNKLSHRDRIAYRILYHALPLEV